MDLVGINVPNIYSGKRVLDALPVIYTLPGGFVAITAAGVATATIQTQQNTVFRCLYMTAKVRPASGDDTRWKITPIKFQLTNVATGQRLFTDQVSALACCGATGGLPYVFPIPWDVEGNGNVQVDFTNTNPNDALQFELYLHGFKMFLANG